MTTLVTARFAEEYLSRLELIGGGPVRREGYGVTHQVMQPDPFRELLVDVSVLVSEFEVVDEAALDAAPRLRVITCCRNEPHASVDLRAATERGIPVLFTPGRNARAVAEFTIGLILSLQRGIAESHHWLKYTERFVASGDLGAGQLDNTAQWGLEPGDPFDVFQGPELLGSTLGLVGCGAIGTQIAHIASALGMKVIAFDPYLSTADANAHGIELTDLDTLAKTSDVVTIAAKVTQETCGMIGEEFLNRMRRTAVLVNTARAAIVDYQALEAALHRKSIRGAALDVFPSEPLPADSPLRGLGNVLLTPHLAGASPNVVRHHTEIALADLQRFVQNERPLYCANPEVLDAGHIFGRADG